MAKPSASDPVISIRHVGREDVEGLASVRALLAEYIAFLLETLGTEHVYLRHFEQELTRLPGEYASPTGALLLATCDGIPAGCVSLHTIELADAQKVGEMRRMWVRPAFRGCSIGKALVRAAIDTTQIMGYSALYLDTVAEKMPAALRLYFSAGFEECPRYNNNPVPGLIFLRLPTSFKLEHSKI